LRTPVEVMRMANEAGITISNDIKSIPEVKQVQKLFELEEQKPDIIFVYQKKKGKPQKKVTAFALAKPGHVRKMVYAMLTPDTDLKELFRKAKALVEESEATPA